MKLPACGVLERKEKMTRTELGVQKRSWQSMGRRSWKDEKRMKSQREVMAGEPPEEAGTKLEVVGL